MLILCEIVSATSEERNLTGNPSKFILFFHILQLTPSNDPPETELPDPNKARIMSIIAHSVYGLGLYGSAILIHALTSKF
ncbi:hypothetical protein ACS126_12295 [Sphingobacterium lactis]|uniref:hypothetical protein n=1 Tax=Sphingobacterium lactis TaxID=797291 RepID=UPI003EC6F282